jgi:xylose isomerase
MPSHRRWTLASNFFLVKLLEDKGYAGPKHFDAHALRTSDVADVWEFAKGCMRTYLILKEKVQHFNSDSEIQAILAELNAPDSIIDPLLAGGYTKDTAKQLKHLSLDANELAKKPLPYEKLDQLTFEVLTGIR